MNGHYAFDADPARAFVRITLTGFFDIETIAAFDRARRPAFASLGCGPNQHLSLCDVTGCNLQSQEAVAAFKSVMSDRSLYSRKLAFVTGSSLARMQVRRILERESVGCFETEADALAWLFATDPAPAA